MNGADLRLLSRVCCRLLHVTLLFACFVRGRDDDCSSSPEELSPALSFIDDGFERVLDRLRRRLCVKYGVMTGERGNEARISSSSFGDGSSANEAQISALSA